MFDHDSDFIARQRIGTTVAVLSAALASGASLAADDVEILARVRKAGGWGSGSPLVIEGDAECYGSKGHFTLVTGSSGRFRERVDAPLGRTRGDDGETGWEIDASGMPRRLDADERDRARLATWIWTGQWLDPAAKIVATVKSSQPERNQLVLAIGMASHPWRAELVIDGQTWLPRSLTSSGASGPEVVEFTRYLEHEGRKVAGTVASQTGNIPTFTGKVAAIRSSVAEGDRAFAPIDERPDDTHFNAGQPAQVHLERARTGQLLVYPTIDGVNLGAFVLDSGASATVISTEAAKKLGLPVLGTVPLGSMFGSVAANVHRAGSLRLGPATITGVYLVEMDLAPLTSAFGLNVQGIVGYDLFSRCAVDLTLAQNKLSLHEPASGELDGLRWLPLSLPLRHPAVMAKAAGVPEGPFRLDLGAAGGPVGNVIFHGDTVNKYHLLDGRQVARVQAGKLHLGVGEIAWFELAGHRFERPQVLFALDAEGVLGKAGTLGNIGVEFLRTFRIVFDYSRSRIAFNELAKGMPPEAEN